MSLAEENVKHFFGNRLPYQRYRLAVSIFEAVYESAKKMSEAEWQTRVQTERQTLQCRLNETNANTRQACFHFGLLWLQWVAGLAAEHIWHKQELAREYYAESIDYVNNIPETAADEWVREPVLKLYVNLGSSYRELENWEKAREIYQRGLDYAKPFLSQETSAGVREQVLKLYGNLGSSYGQLGNLEKAREIYQQGLDYAESFLSPQETSAGVREPVFKLYSNLGNSYGKLENREKEIETYQQGLNYAEPFLSQETSADVREPVLTLYDNLAAALSNQGYYSLATRYLSIIGYLLVDVAKSQIPQHWEILIRNCYRRLNAVPSPTHFSRCYQTFFHTFLDQWTNDCTQLSTQEKLTGYVGFYLLEQTRTRQWLQQAYDRLAQLHEIVADHQTHWQQEIDNPRRAQIPELQRLWSVFYPKEPLSDYPNSYRCSEKLEKLSGWKTWWYRSKRRKLARLLENYSNDVFTKSIELKTKWDWYRNQEQVEEGLLKWLYETLKDVYYLDSAAVEGLLTELADEKAAVADLLAALQLIILSESKSIDSARKQHAEETLKDTIKRWLKRQGDSDIFDMPTALDNLKCQFARILHILPKNLYYSSFDLQVIEHVNYYLQELLQTVPTVPLEKLWEALEISRIGLTHLTIKDVNLEKWQENTGKALKAAFKTMLDTVRQCCSTGYTVEKSYRYPLFSVWIQALGKLIPSLPTVADCQQHLRSDEALLQPFFDPHCKKLRILWLDNNGLQLRDLPEICAIQTNWFNPEKTGITDKWVASWVKQEKSEKTNDPWDDTVSKAENNWLEKLEKSKNPYDLNQDAHWQNTMGSEPVQTFANTLRAWADAQQLRRLTVIFPAPLGQLPWEILTPLEALLIRAVSVHRWQQPPKTPASTPLKTWVVGMGNLDKDLRYCNAEATWVAKQWGTQPDLPTKSISIFNALYQLKTCQRVLLSTHGTYSRENPLNSNLELGSKSQHPDEKSQHPDEKSQHPDKILPLWLCSILQIEVQCLILSACNTHVSGRQAEKLLSPLGIAPALSAAGATTVIGSLWEVREVSTICFIYKLLRLQSQYPDESWTDLVRRARCAVRDMTREDLKEIQQDMQLSQYPVGEDLLNFQQHVEKWFLSHPMYWAGFGVL